MNSKPEPSFATTIEPAITPQITVIIPTYNRRDWLQEAIESVLSESRISILVHVFDNASTDGTADYVCKLIKIDPRVRHTRHPSNLGSLLNYDVAFRAIETPFFVPLADDDWLLPNFLYDSYQIILEQPDLGAVIFQTQHVIDDGTVVATNPSNDRAVGRLEAGPHLADWMGNGHYQWSSILWNRQVLDCVGGAPSLAVGLPNDVDFEGQVFCRFPVSLVQRPGAVFRLHGTQEHLGVLTGDWSLILRRLYAAVFASGAITPAEYARLKAILIRRWRINWRRMLSGRGWGETVKASWNLGFRLRSPFFGLLLLWRKLSEGIVVRRFAKIIALRTRLRRLQWLKGDSAQ